MALTLAQKMHQFAVGSPVQVKMTGSKEFGLPSRNAAMTFLGVETVDGMEYATFEFAPGYEYSFYENSRGQWITAFEERIVSAQAL